MLVFQIIGQLLVRLALAAAFFLIILLVGYLFVTPDRTTRQQTSCTWLQSAEFEMAGLDWSVPALRRTSVVYDNPSAFPDMNSFLEYQEDFANKYDYVQAELRMPWDKEPLGFCAEKLANQPLPTSVWIEDEAANHLTSAVLQMNEPEIDRIVFGMNGFGHWIAQLDEDQSVPADWFILDAARSNPQFDWYSYTTAGWIGGNYRISAFCSAQAGGNGTVGKRCSVRIVRKSDGLLVEFWNLDVSGMPVGGEPIPDEIQALIPKAEQVLAHFSDD